MGRRAKTRGAAVSTLSSWRHQGSWSRSCGIGSTPIVADLSDIARNTWPIV